MLYAITPPRECQQLIQHAPWAALWPANGKKTSRLFSAEPLAGLVVNDDRHQKVAVIPQKPRDRLLAAELVNLGHVAVGVGELNPCATT